MKFIKYLLLLVFILGGLPVSQTGDLRAESASEQTKKKRKKKKKAPVKNPLQVKKNPQVSLKRKKKEKEEEARRRSKIREH